METSTSAAMNSRGVRQRRWPGVLPARQERDDGNRGNFPARARAQQGAGRQKERTYETTNTIMEEIGCNMSGRDAEEAQKTADSGGGEGRAGHAQMSSRWMPESWFTLLPAGRSRGLKGDSAHT